MKLHSVVSSDSFTLREKTNKLPIFQNMIKGVPENDKSDNIAAVTNFDYDKLLITMFCLGLVQEIRKYVKKIIAVKQDEW